MYHVRRISKYRGDKVVVQKDCGGQRNRFRHWIGRKEHSCVAGWPNFAAEPFDGKRDQVT